jgi:hypothetical protein
LVSSKDFRIWLLVNWILPTQKSKIWSEISYLLVCELINLVFSKYFWTIFILVCKLILFLVKKLPFPGPYTEIFYRLPKSIFSNVTVDIGWGNEKLLDIPQNCNLSSKPRYMVLTHFAFTNEKFVILILLWFFTTLTVGPVPYSMKS